MEHPGGCDKCPMINNEQINVMTKRSYCDDCLVVNLLPENKDALDIYSIVQDQFIMGPEGATAINDLAIYKAMDLLNIQNRQETFFKVKYVCDKVIERIQRKIKLKR